MKRLRRLLFNALAALSLTLFLLTIIAWAQSVPYNAGLGYIAPPDTHRSFLYTGVFSYAGRIVFRTFTPDPNLAYKPTLGFYGLFARRFGTDDWPWLIGTATTNSGPGFGVAGFLWAQGRTYQYGVYTCAVPDWFLAGLFLILPWQWIRKLSTSLSGYCANCGYDLRATPDCCPECGAVSAKQNSK